MITNLASRAAAMLMNAATQSTATQLPVYAVSTLASGTSSEAVPLAVYKKPLLAAANFEPKVSPLTAGKMENISPQQRKIIGAKIMKPIGLWPNCIRPKIAMPSPMNTCLLYTSDAADE